MGAAGVVRVPAFADDVGGVGVEGAAAGFAEVGGGGVEAVVGGLGVEVELIAVASPGGEVAGNEAETFGAEFFEGGGVAVLLGEEVGLGGVKDDEGVYRRHLVAAVFPWGDVDTGEEGQASEQGRRTEQGPPDEPVLASSDMLSDG